MLSLIVGRRGKERLRSFLRKLALAVFLVMVALLLIYTAFRRWTMMVPPSDEGGALPETAVVKDVQGLQRLTVGDSWMERRNGLWHVRLGGNPRMMGHAHGVLGGRIVAEIDRHMLTLMKQFVKTSMRRWLLGNVVRWRFRHLPESIPPRLLVELAAFSRTVVDTEDFPEAPFQRLIYFHALHDMTQRLDGSPLIGCTAFAAWGNKSVDDHLIVGRNFDFEGGPIFDRQKAVISFHAPDRNAVVSVAWPGMMGVVTGVNSKRLFVSINAARTGDPLQPGIPMAFLVRKILEEADSIKDALEVIKRHEVMVAEALLIADGKVPEAVVVELSPSQMIVRRSKSGIIGVTNHFLNPKFKADANNDWLRRYTTSEARYNRLMQLLKRFGGRLDPRTAALILRNRTGLDDEPLSLGNRNAIDALIATHGVVLDLTEMVLYVSRGPHLLGAFSVVDLKPIFGIPAQSKDPPQEISADSLFGSSELDRYRQAMSQLDYASALEKSGHLSLALEYARRSVQMLADSPRTHRVLGDLLWQADRREEAKKHYRRFLELFPPYLRDQERVKSRLIQ